MTEKVTGKYQKSTLTVERLRELLAYNPETGLLTWAKQQGKQLIGSPAGSKSESLGYLLVGIDGTKHYAHRLAWYHFYGEWPKYVVDHRDSNGYNNSISNLQDVTQRVNVIKGKQFKGREGKCPPGTYQSKTVPGKFLGKITCHGKQIHLGVFDNKIAAYEAYRVAKLKYHNIVTPEYTEL